MAIETFRALSIEGSLTPASEISRVNYIRDNRALSKGDFTLLGIQDRQSETQALSIKNNLFRLAAQFYPDFMLAEAPSIIVEGNERLTTVLGEFTRFFWEELRASFTDQIGLGWGCLVSAPENPLLMQWFPPDQWFEVLDARGQFIGDLLYRIVDVGTSQRVFLYEFPVTGPSRERIYDYGGGSLGGLVSTRDLPTRSGRQVLPLLPPHQSRGGNDLQGASIFDDMRPHVYEMSQASTSLSTTIRRNARPHLYGPAGAITQDADGKAVVNVDGMYFPLEADDRAPGYLQWDSKIEAIEWSWNRNYDQALNAAGLTRFLFDPDVRRSGVLSGSAMRRLLIPFIARLNRYQTGLEKTVEDYIALLNRNFAAQGLEIFEYNRSNITIQWQYASLFEDPTTGGTGGGTGGAA